MIRGNLRPSGRIFGTSPHTGCSKVEYRSLGREINPYGTQSPIYPFRIADVRAKAGGVPTAEANGKSTATLAATLGGASSTEAEGASSVVLSVSVSGPGSQESVGSETIVAAAAIGGAPTSEDAGAALARLLSTVGGLSSAEAHGAADAVLAALAAGGGPFDAYGAIGLTPSGMAGGIPSAETVGKFSSRTIRVDLMLRGAVVQTVVLEMPVAATVVLGRKP